MPPSSWVWDEEDHVWVIRGLDCEIWMVARPAHCDRGNWLADIDVFGDRLRCYIDDADRWPRYYFDLDRAKLEIEAFLKKRQQWVEASNAGDQDTRRDSTGA